MSIFSKHAKQRVRVDACNIWCGAVCNGDWRYTVFRRDMPATEKLHINYKEVCAVFQAVQRWVKCWEGKEIVIHTDSSVTKAIINKERSRNHYVNRLLR